MIVLALGAGVMAAYAASVGMYNVRYPHRRFPVTRIVAFCAGTAITVAVLLPAADALADASFAYHMLQHLTLALIVPPLLLLGAPLTLAVSLAPPPAGRSMARIVRHPIADVAASPLLAWLVFVGVLWGIHFSPLYELALQSVPLHAAEHVLLIGAALLFWMPVVSVGFVLHPLAFPVRAFYLFLAIPQGAFLGLVIYSAPNLLYPHYLIGRSMSAALSDQHNAGAVMWIGGGALLFAAFMLTAAVWANHRQQEEGLA